MQISMKTCCKLILWFWWGLSNIPKVPKIASFQCLFNIPEKMLEMKLIFCMLININFSYKLISTQFPTSWYYHYWWAWSSFLTVLKVTSLQYLYNISKKKWGIDFVFCMQVSIKVSTSCRPFNEYFERGW